MLSRSETPFSDRLDRLVVSLEQAWTNNPEQRTAIENAVEDHLIRPTAEIVVGIMRGGTVVDPRSNSYGEGLLSRLHGLQGVADQLGALGEELQELDVDDPDV